MLRLVFAAFFASLKKVFGPLRKACQSSMSKPDRKDKKPGAVTTTM
jgi:hypothetical protein